MHTEQKFIFVAQKNKHQITKRSPTVAKLYDANWTKFLKNKEKFSSYVIKRSHKLDIETR